MVPGVGRPNTESAWAFGNGPKEVRKKQIMMVRVRIFLDIMTINRRKRFLERIAYIWGLSNQAGQIYIIQNAEIYDVMRNNKYIMFLLRK
jgi:hypothetical protein